LDISLCFRLALKRIHAWDGMKRNVSRCIILPTKITFDPLQFLKYLVNCDFVVFLSPNE
jgi:hypothetical protein